MSECKRSLPDDLQCDLPNGHTGSCKGTKKRCLCYYAIADFDGTHHDSRCERAVESAPATEPPDYCDTDETAELLKREDAPATEATRRYMGPFNKYEDYPADSPAPEAEFIGKSCAVRLLPYASR